MLKGSCHTKAARKKLSEATKRQFSDPKAREQARKTNLAMWADPIWANRQRKTRRSAISRRRHSIATKKQWKENRDSMVAAFNSPEVKRRFRKTSIKLWKQEKYRNPVVQAIARASGSHKPNGAERQLNKILKKKFPGEFKLNTRGGFILEGRIPDFVNCNGRKVVVELFGDYWHGMKKTGRTAEEEEQVRRRIFAPYGFKTAIIWEHELEKPKRVIRKVLEQMVDSHG